VASFEDRVGLAWRNVHRSLIGNLVLAPAGRTLANCRINNLSYNETSSRCPVITVRCKKSVQVGSLTAPRFKYPCLTGAVVIVGFEFVLRMNLVQNQPASSSLTCVATGSPVWLCRFGHFHSEGALESGRLRSESALRRVFCRSVELISHGSWVQANILKKSCRTRRFLAD
jgi:hypothetical protein